MQVGDDDQQQDNAAQTPAENAASGAADDNQDGQQQAQDGASAAGDDQDGGEGQQGNALQDAAAQQQPPKQKNPSKAYQGRIDELTKNWRGTQRELEAALARIAELEAGGRQQPSADDQNGDQQPARRQEDVVPANMVDRLAEQKAQRLAEQRQFDNDCNLTFMKGKAQFPDFEEKLGAFSALGGLEREVVEDALATDAPHEVLYALGGDEEEAARILKLPRAKRIAEFTKMTLKAPPKPTVSKAPAPIKPVNGNAKPAFDYADDNADDREWFARRDKDRQAAGRI